MVQTILYAEDDPISYMIVDLRLSKKGYHIIRATTGFEAITMFDSKKTDISLILMDMCMPEMTGYEATKHIREKNTDIPIIAITAGAFEEDKLKCIESGCTDYLSKPLEVNKLFDMLTKYIK